MTTQGIEQTRQRAALLGYDLMQKGPASCWTLRDRLGHVVINAAGWWGDGAPFYGTLAQVNAWLDEQLGDDEEVMREEQALDRLEQARRN